MISDVQYLYPTSDMISDVGYRYRTSDMISNIGYRYRTSDIISDYSSVEGHAVAVIVSQMAPHTQASAVHHLQSLVDTH